LLDRHSTTWTLASPFLYWVFSLIFILSLSPSLFPFFFLYWVFCR
jgi:hypothetical protein